MVHKMAWCQFHEDPNIIPFSQLAAERVSIFDVIRELPTLCPALEALLLKGKVRTRAREVF